MCVFDNDFWRDEADLESKKIRSIDVASHSHSHTHSLSHSHALARFFSVIWSAFRKKDPCYATMFSIHRAATGNDDFHNNNDAGDDDDVDVKNDSLKRRANNDFWQIFASVGTGLSFCRIFFARIENPPNKSKDKTTSHFISLLAPHKSFQANQQWVLAPSLKWLEPNANERTSFGLMSIIYNCISNCVTGWHYMRR